MCSSDLFPVDTPAAIDRVARIIRLDVASSTGGNTGAREIRITGAAIRPPSPSPVP